MRSFLEVVTGVGFQSVGEEKFYQELESHIFWKKLGNRSEFTFHYHSTSLCSQVTCLTRINLLQIERVLLENKERIKWDNVYNTYNRLPDIY